MPSLTQGDKAADRRFMEQQHRYRGLIAEYRSRRFVENRKTPPARQFRSDCADLLIDIRAAISPEQYRSMLEWIGEMAAGQLGDLAQVPVGYDDLSGIHPRAPAAPLEQELLWIAERIRMERRRVAEFLTAKALVEYSTLRGDYENAIAAVDLIQTAFGITLWSVQLRLALEHQAGGLERQKRYSAEVRAIYRRGLLGFVTYHSSVRNEERTTLAKFLDDIESRINGHAYYSDTVKTYARYRLKNEFPASSAAMADILQVEQSHGILDIYETYVAVLQELAGREPDSALAQLIVRCVSIANVQDFRLIKVARLLDPSTPMSLPPRDRSASNALFAGSAVTAALAARRGLRDRIPVDPWHYIYAGFALAHGERTRPAPPLRPTTIAQLIGRVQSRCPGAADAWSQAAKLALNFRGLAVSAGVLELLNAIKRSAPDQRWRPWLIGLNSPTFGIEDCPWDRPLDPALANLSDATMQVWRAAFGMAPTTILGQSVLHLARAAGYIHRQEYLAAIETLDQGETEWPEPLRAVRALLLLHAYYARGHRQKVIELVANEGARSAAHRQFLPVVGSLKEYGWEDFKETTAPLAAPIALHLLWTAHEDPVIASRLRFATGLALRQAQVTRPSELAEADQEIPLHGLVYFLDKVCVPDILDLSRLFRSSREIIEERQAVCGKLEDLDPGNATVYRDEIILIANQLALDEGRRIVDGTRIHVDRDALIRWTLRELAEDFDRYRDLASVSVDAPQSFEDVLNELNESGAQRATFSPDNEADAVLVSILKRMGEEFLDNASFGLDFYLSKRVRHQSFIGLIRGPLEFAELITTRETELGDYHRNDQWVDRFSLLGDEDRERIDNALRHFAKRFDETLTEAKDSFFHIRSSDHPQGMIVLTLSSRLLALARVMAQLDLDFLEFARLAVSLLWVGLEPSLASVRRLISDSIKTDLAKEFDTVRATVRGIAEDDPAFLDFDFAMGKGSAEVQVKLDEAAQWFVHAEAVDSQRTFTLEQILKIGLDAALKTQRGYTPRITQSTEGDIELQPASLVFVHDVLFVGLGNAHKHSGLKSPAIDVTARWDAENEALAIEVVSDCRPSNRKEKENGAAVIRRSIKAGSATARTRIEGGSGFAKLAAVIEQNDRANLDFGFTPGGRFRLEVTYAAIMQDNEVVYAA